MPDSLVMHDLWHPTPQIQHRARPPQHLAPPLQHHLPTLPRLLGYRYVVGAIGEVPCAEASETDQEQEERVLEARREEGSRLRVRSGRGGQQGGRLGKLVGRVSSGAAVTVVVYLEEEDEVAYRVLAPSSVLASYRRDESWMRKDLERHTYPARMTMVGRRFARRLPKRLVMSPRNQRMMKATERPSPDWSW